VHDKQTLNEFKTYVRHANGVWKKQTDSYFDDRVEALIWGIFALDSKVVEQYYEVMERDGNGKPLKIIPINFDPYQGSMPKLNEVYNRLSNGKIKEEIVARNPFHIGNPNTSGNADIDELMAEGWRPLNSADSTSTSMMFYQ
jgi:hypothetical protein